MLPSIPSAPPPISKLNPDVLLHIFALNTESEFETNYAGITNLRHASQVCSSWRKLVLSSPVLWSRALDFDAFHPRQQEWKAEVMKRTGTSWLRIKASKETLISMQSWIHLVLDEHWARIRYLKLVFSRWCIPSEEWLSIFRRPAHRLESFQVTFHHSRPVIFKSSISSALFDNNAPRLRTFSVRNASLDLATTCWASNLRCLALNSSTPLFNLFRVFFVFQFPFLESLELADSDNCAENTFPKPLSLHPISLPRLKTITIQPNTEFASSLSFLANMTPAPGCQLTFDASADRREAFIVDDLPRVFNRFLPDSHATTKWKNDCTSDPNSVTSAFFSLSKYSFNFSFCPLSNGPSIVDFTLNCIADSGLPGQAICAMATSTLSFPLRKIKKLILFISPGDTHSAPLVPHADIDAAVEGFVRAAGCVEELFTDTQSLEWLEAFQKRAGVVVFPYVKKAWDSQRGEVQMPRV